MQASTTREGSKGIIKLAGRFDFNRHREFRGAYEPLLDDAAIQEVIVDMGGVDYLDSSALGMLLMLKDKVSASKKSVALTNVSGSVRQVLDIANFGKLFRII